MHRSVVGMLHDNFSFLFLHLRMERRSLESKRKKRKAQKQKRKMKNIVNTFNYNPPSDVTDRPSVTSSDSIESCTMKPPDYSVTEEIIGLDLDALEMETDNQLPQDETVVDDDTQEGFYGSFEYLQQCRSRLISKVKKYRDENEKLKTESVILAAKHRREVEAIRTFYKNVTFGLTRSSVIFRNALK